MERKAVSGIMLTLLLINVLTLVFNAQSVEIIVRIIYIRADGSIDPSTANIISVDNVTYTFTDNNYHSIRVERSNIIIDGMGYSLETNGRIGVVGFQLRNVRNVTIKNTSIKNFLVGIYLESASNNSISGNNITASLNVGINLYDSSNNRIIANNITNGWQGMALAFSSNNFLSENVMNGNIFNLYVRGGEPGHFMHSIDVSNLVDAKPVYYLLNRKDLIIKPATHPQVGYLALINCSRATVENLNLTNNGQGLLLAYTNNSKITDNNIINNDYGVLLWHSSNNSISGNNITNNLSGVPFASSTNNSIYRNNVTNNERGIYLSDSSNNTFSENNITANQLGVFLRRSSNNHLFGNNITNNSEGIVLTRSSSNIFYHNNFVKNQRQVYLYESFDNAWDDGYPSGGNYWSDYEYKYPEAKELDGSGIWDTPYVIDGNNQDNYPLMEPWSPKPPSPVEATQELIETIETWNLSKGLENSLTSKLDNVFHHLNKGNEKGANHKLIVLINQVGALRGKKLTSEQANYLITEAQRIIDLISG